MTTSPTSTPSKLAGSNLNPPAPTFTKWTVGSVEGVGVGVDITGDVRVEVGVGICAETTESSCRSANGIASRIHDESIARDV